MSHGTILEGMLCYRVGRVGTLSSDRDQGKQGRQESVPTRGPLWAVRRTGLLRRGLGKC